MSGMITVKHKGDFKNIEKFFKTVGDAGFLSKLSKYGEEGVEALRAATPVDTGKTASCWEYRITGNSQVTKIEWHNTNVNNYVNIAVILQYGHGTGTGGYVAGRDYINPAMRPVFDRIAEECWKEVTNA